MQNPFAFLSLRSPSTFCFIFCYGLKSVYCSFKKKKQGVCSPLLSSNTVLQSGQEEEEVEEGGEEEEEEINPHLGTEASLSFTGIQIQTFFYPVTFRTQTSSGAIHLVNENGSSRQIYICQQFC